MNQLACVVVGQLLDGRQLRLRHDCLRLIQIQVRHIGSRLGQPRPVDHASQRCSLDQNGEENDRKRGDQNEVAAGKSIGHAQRQGQGDHTADPGPAKDGRTGDAEGLVALEPNCITQFDGEVGSEYPSKARNGNRDQNRKYRPSLGRAASDAVEVSGTLRIFVGI